MLNGRHLTITFIFSAGSEDAEELDGFRSRIASKSRLFPLRMWDAASELAVEGRVAMFEGFDVYSRYLELELFGYC